MLIARALVPLRMAAHFRLLLGTLLLAVARIPRALPELGALAHLRLRWPVQVCNGIVQDVLLSLR